MASIETRTNSDQSVSHRVRFRHQGKNVPKTFDTRAAAEEFKAAVELLGPDRAIALLDSPDPVARERTRTLGQQVAHHIDHLTGIEEGTRRKYRKIAAARIDAHPIGRTLLTDITRDDVSRWVNAQTGAPKTIRNAHSLLSGALSSAVRDGLMPGNVAKGVRLPKRDADTEEHVYLTHEEFGTLLAMLPEHYRPFTVFLVGTGVRFSEASALRAKDVNLRDSSAYIRQAWKDTSGAGYKLGAPKTTKSRRTIGLPPQIVAMLDRVMAGRKPDEYVFVNRRGNPIRNGVFHESAWQRVMDELEATVGKRPRVHDLRHTYASWAISAGIPLPVIQRQMGHESIQTTVDTYGALVRSDLDALALTIGRGLPQLEAY